jgi:hypothetical protein
MSNYAVYSTNTGQINRIVSCSEDQAVYQAQQGEAILPVDLNVAVNSGYVANGAVVSYPAQQSPFQSWNWETLAWTDQRSTAQAQSDQWTIVKAARDAALAGGFTWNGFIFDSDDVSQQRIQGAVQLSVLATSQGQAYSIVWTLADNSCITLAGADMVNVGIALGVFVQAQFEKGVTLRNQINAATTLDAITAVVWQ